MTSLAEVPGKLPGGPDSYQESRRLCYPPVQSQLDSIWHSMNTGMYPKCEPWFSTIKSVKDLYPSSEELVTVGVATVVL